MHDPIQFPALPQAALDRLKSTADRLKNMTTLRGKRCGDCAFFVMSINDLKMGACHGAVPKVEVIANGGQGQVVTIRASVKESDQACAAFEV